MACHGPCRRRRRAGFLECRSAAARRVRQGTVAAQTVRRHPSEAEAHSWPHIIRRSAVGGRRSAVGGRRSAVGGRRSAVGGRRSAVGGRRSAVGGREPTTGTPAVSSVFGLSPLNQVMGTVLSIGYHVDDAVHNSPRARRPESAFERTCRHHPAASGTSRRTPVPENPAPTAPRMPPGSTSRPAVSCVAGGVGAMRHRLSPRLCRARGLHPPRASADRAMRRSHPPPCRAHAPSRSHRQRGSSPCSSRPCRCPALSFPCSRLGCRSGTQRPVARLAAARTAPRSQHSRAQSGGNFQAGTSGTC